MHRTRATLLLVVFLVGLAALVASGERSTSSGGFSELHRAQLSDAGDVELVMGVLERDGESTSGKHYHPGGEFGFVLSGAIVISTEGNPAKALEAGDSFYQPPGEWHVVTTGGGGARTVVFRAIEGSQPMVVPVE